MKIFQQEANFIEENAKIEYFVSLEEESKFYSQVLFENEEIDEITEHATIKEVMNEICYNLLWELRSKSEEIDAETLALINRYEKTRENIVE